MKEVRLIGDSVLALARLKPCFRRGLLSTIPAPAHRERQTNHTLPIFDCFSSLATSKRCGSSERLSSSVVQRGSSLRVNVSHSVSGKSLALAEL